MNPTDLREYAVLGARIRLQELDAIRAELLAEFPELSERTGKMTGARTSAPLPRSNAKTKKRGSSREEVLSFVLGQDNAVSAEEVVSATGLRKWTVSPLLRALVKEKELSVEKKGVRPLRYLK